MKNPRGYLMLLALVFGTIFLTVLGSLSSFTLSENRVQTMSVSRAKAFSIAEAGLEYYRWWLAHNSNGNNINATSSIRAYADPEGGMVGSFTLSVTPIKSCAQVNAIDIVSTGTTADGAASRTLSARYARPSVAQYSYVLNDSVWAGADRVINGPYHSNGGIRMDGTANAPVTSSVSTWNCTSSFGCSPSQGHAPGVVGNGTNQNLWDYPTPQVDFDSISSDFSSLKATAQASGLYYARYSSSNQKNSSAYWKGYHLIFNSNGTVTVKRVSSTNQLTPDGWLNPSDDDDGVQDRMLINNETTLGTYTIPSTCGLIFVEDNTWVEGTISGKVTLVVASTDASIDVSTYLRGNILYATGSGTDGLSLISERNVLITPDSPQNMTLNGIFIAQAGAFGRNLYDCPSSYEPNGTLTILGTTVSNKRTGTKWLNGCGSGSNAGYATRIDAFDRQMVTNPPPFTPTTSSDYRFVEWREK